jgi:hypothetical protein
MNTIPIPYNSLLYMFRVPSAECLIFNGGIQAGIYKIYTVFIYLFFYLHHAIESLYLCIKCTNFLHFRYTTFFIDLIKINLGTRLQVE